MRDPVKSVCLFFAKGTFICFLLGDISLKGGPLPWVPNEKEGVRIRYHYCQSSQTWVSEAGVWPPCHVYGVVCTQVCLFFCLSQDGWVTAFSINHSRKKYHPQNIWLLLMLSRKLKKVCWKILMAVPVPCCTSYFTRYFTMRIKPLLHIVSSPQTFWCSWAIAEGSGRP